MRRVRRQVKKEKASFLPNRSQFFYLMITMYRCVIQYRKGVFAHLKGELIKKLDNFVRSISNCLEIQVKPRYTQAMSYDRDLRLRALEYAKEGHTLVQTAAVLKVNIGTNRRHKNKSPLSS